MFKTSTASLRWYAALAIGVLAAVSMRAAQLGSASASSPGRQRALLVGVTEFIAPAMRKFDLEGPANDVALIRDLLRDRFKVPDAAITVLAGLPDAEDLRPTRANIEREFLRLADEAAPGDQILILLAGHGSQQPAAPDPDDEEPDGLDEIFLPADTDGWSADRSQVTNVIVDDDIRGWLSAIKDKGALVTIVVDACHSGTITRAGPSGWRDRGIAIGELVPPSVLASLTTRSRASSPFRSLSVESFDLPGVAGNVAALYAADTGETTPELRMPDRDGQTHGLFTYTLARILMERTAPITYRDLVQRVIDRYRADGFMPTPSLEGATVDREVMGDRIVRERPTFSIDTEQHPDRWRVSAGRVHGLTQDSILEVLAPGASDSSVGYAQVREVHPTTAVVTPISFAAARMPRVEDVPRGSRVRIVHSAFGALQLRVALEDLRAGETAALALPGTGPAELEAAFTDLTTLTDGLARRETAADAEWFVRMENRRVVLLSSSERERAIRGPYQSAPTGKRFDVGSATDSRLPFLLADHLRRIARAANLSRLSSHVDPVADLRIQLRRHTRGSGAPALVSAASRHAEVQAGDRLQITIENTGQVPLDFTILYMDANFGIYPLFPAAERALDNRIDAGGRRDLAPVEITADPLGWESIVALGVESTPRHENFLMLAQDALIDTRSTDGPKSPLRLLLESAAFGSRAAAPPDAADAGRFAIAQTWFQVTKAGQ